VSNNFDFNDNDKDNPFDDDNPFADDQSDGFDDFFDTSDDDLFGDNQLPADDFDEELLLDEEEGGGNRTFIILAAVLAVIFVVLVAVVAALILSGGESCGEDCELATAITIQNETTIAQENAAATEASIFQTSEFETLEADNATSTAEFIAQETATRAAQDTAVAATETQESIDATATQVEIFANSTATALASITPSPTATDPPTATPEEVEPTQDPGVGGALPGEGVLAEVDITDADGNPLANVVVCIFLDDGDGQFDPSPDTEGNCAVANLFGGDSSGGTTDDDADTDDTDTDNGNVDGGGDSEPPDAPTPEGDAPVETEAPATEEPTEPAQQLNPIFQTATANAAGASNTDTTDDGGDTDAGGTDGGFNAPAPPTPESIDGSSYVPNEVAQRRGRTEPHTNGAPFQDDGGDQLEIELTTDDQGRLVLPQLPEGSYFIKVADQTVEFDVTTEPQIVQVQLDDGGTLELVVPGTDEEPTPNVPPLFQTATSAAQQTAQAGDGSGGGVPTITQESIGDDDTMATPDQLAETGLFDGQGGEVTTTDLIILALIGAVLIGVVFGARRMRAQL